MTSRLLTARAVADRLGVNPETVLRWTRRGKLTRETPLRRMANRQGYRLVKSRRRDPRAIGYGRYMLTDPWRSNAVIGPEGVGPTGEPNWTLDDVEEFLTTRLGNRNLLAPAAGAKAVCLTSLNRWHQRSLPDEDAPPWPTTAT